MDVIKFADNPFNYLTELCEQRGLSLHAVCKAAGLNHQLVYNWKKSTPVSFYNAWRILNKIAEAPETPGVKVFAAGQKPLTKQRLIELKFNDTGVGLFYGTQDAAIWFYPGEDIWQIRKSVNGKFVEVPVSVATEKELRMLYRIVSDGKEID